MKIKIAFAGLIAATTCLLFIKGCLFKKYTLIDCTSQEVQSIVAEVNSGIGEGRYETILIVHGKDSFLVSSCTALENEWERISSTGEPREGKSLMERERILNGCLLKNPLGCYRLGEIVCYGFSHGTNEVYLIVENFGDEGGKFPEQFWEVISRNRK